MTKRKLLTRPPNKGKSRYNTAVASNGKAAPGHINIVPLQNGLRASNLFFRRRALTIVACASALIWFNHWDTTDMRRMKAAEPYLVGLCGAATYADGLGRRFAGEDDKVVKAVLHDMSLLGEALHDDCTIHYSGLRRSQAWLRDRKTKSRAPNADPLPRPQGETIEVAYSEGTAP